MNPELGKNHLQLNETDQGRIFREVPVVRGSLVKLLAKGGVILSSGIMLDNPEVKNDALFELEDLMRKRPVLELGRTEALKFYPSVPHIRTASGLKSVIVIAPGADQKLLMILPHSTEQGFGKRSSKGKQVKVLHVKDSKGERVPLKYLRTSFENFSSNYFI